MKPHQNQNNNRSYPGRGIAQWGNKYAKRSTRFSGRWDNLVDYANNRKGKDAYEFETQLESIVLN